MANVELKHEKSGRKITVNEAVAEHYAAHGWAEAKKTRTASTKAGSGNAESDTGEGAATSSKTTKRGASSAS